MDMMCPICNNIITLEVNPEDNSRLIGKCGHFPGGFPKEVIDIPNPDYIEPVKHVRKSKGETA
jgi:hypothetical protein